MPSHIPRLWLPAIPSGQTLLVLDDDAQAHHLRTVLRVQAGDEVRVFNATAGEYEASVKETSRKSVSLTLGAMHRAPAPMPALHLYCALLKRTAMEWLVEKTTELGVTHFHPVISAHTQIKDLNVTRMTAIALEAVQQCGRMDVPVFMPPLALKNIPATAEIFAALEPVGAVYPTLPEARAGTNTTETAILIGPEGGFSDDERHWLVAQKNITPVSLGRHVLRAETAAIVACGIINSGY